MVKEFALNKCLGLTPDSSPVPLAKVSLGSGTGPSQASTDLRIQSRSSRAPRLANRAGRLRLRVAPEAAPRGREVGDGVESRSGSLAAPPVAASERARPRRQSSGRTCGSHAARPSRARLEGGLGDSPYGTAQRSWSTRRMPPARGPGRRWESADAALHSSTPASKPRWVTQEAQAERDTAPRTHHCGSVWESTSQARCHPHPSRRRLEKRRLTGPGPPRIRLPTGLRGSPTNSNPFEFVPKMRHAPSPI
ncbi:uncharacterized protein LOC128594773 [Nycticebus coucang]|uniref:uncharacterized protein LOC128594773 n=1 Tax=Nycticebus coucang TaxID=9470 RepID=UPI00234C1249|nr:uncharacterized protein LOC128594773 [Nycticebus coucang]